jgi:hypothetical protein
MFSLTHYAMLTGDGLDEAALSASWSAVADDLGAPAGATNEDRTITWTIGGARNFSADYEGGNTLNYRINSGAWTLYAGAFSVTSGQTLGWQYIASANESGTITVTDASKGSSLLSGSFGYSAAGWP